MEIVKSKYNSENIHNNCKTKNSDKLKSISYIQPLLKKAEW